MCGIQTFQDGLQLAKDVAGLSVYFGNVPDSLIAIGSDIVAAVANESVAALARAKSDFASFVAAFKSDLTTAATKIGDVSADFDKLIADLTP